MNFFSKFFKKKSSKSEKEKSYLPKKKAVIEERFILKFIENGGKFLYCENLDEVKENFKFANKFPDNIQNLYEEIKSKENSVSVHIRRGDFVSNPTAASFNAQLGSPYYSKAMNILEKNNKSIHYYIFSEDIDWCKENLHNITSYPMTFVDDSYCGDRDSGHFYLMKSCNNHIIANSTYSWWAAFLSNSKITIGPKKWTKEMNGSDIMLDDWIII